MWLPDGRLRRPRRRRAARRRRRLRRRPAARRGAGRRVGGVARRRTADRSSSWPPIPRAPRAAGPVHRAGPVQGRRRRDRARPDAEPHLADRTWTAARCEQLTDGPADDDQPRMSRRTGAGSRSARRAASDRSRASPASGSCPSEGGDPHQVVDAAGQVRAHRVVAGRPPPRVDRAPPGRGARDQLRALGPGGQRRTAAPVGEPRQLGADARPHDRPRRSAATRRGRSCPPDLGLGAGRPRALVTYLEGGTSPLAHIGLDDEVTIVAGGQRGVYAFAVGGAAAGAWRSCRRRNDDPGQLSVARRRPGAHRHRPQPRRARRVRARAARNGSTFAGSRRPAARGMAAAPGLAPGGRGHCRWCSRSTAARTGRSASGSSSTRGGSPRAATGCC